MRGQSPPVRCGQQFRLGGNTLLYIVRSRPLGISIHHLHSAQPIYIRNAIKRFLRALPLLPRSHRQRPLLQLTTLVHRASEPCTLQLSVCAIAFRLAISHRQSVITWWHSRQLYFDDIAREG